MEKIKLYTKCGDCGGDGIVETTSSGNPEVIDPCPACEGSGYHQTGSLDDALGDKLEDIRDKQDDILDKLNDILEKVSE